MKRIRPKRMLLPAAPARVDTGIEVSDRARATIVSLELQGAEVHEALRTFFREHRFGGAVAPDVQGTVTVSLRDVSFETALQNVARQVDASYRIDHGFFEVVKREDSDLIADPASSFGAPTFSDERRAIDDRYHWLSRRISTGEGGSLRKWLGPVFEGRNAGENLTGEKAVRALVDTFRAYPAFKIESVSWTATRDDAAQVVVAYRRGEEPPLFFRDFWKRPAGDVWRLVAREETALPVRHRRFEDAPLIEVLRTLFAEAPIAWSIDSTLDRRVTYEVTGEPWEIQLKRLLRSADTSYYIEAGVYHIVSNDRLSDPGDRTIPFVEFEKTDVRVALSWLCQQAHADFRIDPGVRGLVTVSLRKAPFETALFAVCRKVGASYRLQGGVYEILKPSTIGP